MCVREREPAAGKRQERATRRVCERERERERERELAGTGKFLPPLIKSIFYKVYHF